ncbi:Metallo-dependent phosphatase-like protein [Daedaleopsis nitida]|nr:Metallo-dependent phosphatase-like protein [Daedaleopsis nitida]
MVRLSPRLTRIRGKSGEGYVLWNRFRESARTMLFAREAFHQCLPRPPASQTDAPVDSQSARIVCISDTHSHHHKISALPPGDVLIHAGDLTSVGREEEVNAALLWLQEAPHPHKILIAGNHDRVLANPDIRDRILADYPGLTYLEDSSTTLQVRGRLLSVYGSPRTPRYRRGGSDKFLYPASEAVWDIPPFTDIVVTHGPPAYHLDHEHLGCLPLLHAVRRVRPLLHVFGHIHGGHGLQCVDWGAAQTAYERVCVGSSPWLRALGLLQLSAAALYTKVAGRPRYRKEGDTVLVNASWLGVAKLRGADAFVVDIPLPDRY